MKVANVNNFISINWNLHTTHHNPNKRIVSLLFCTHIIQYFLIINSYKSFIYINKKHICEIPQYAACELYKILIFIGKSWQIMSPSLLNIDLEKSSLAQHHRWWYCTSFFISMKLAQSIHISSFYQNTIFRMDELK